MSLWFSAFNSKEETIELKAKIKTINKDQKENKGIIKEVLNNPKQKGLIKEKNIT